MANRRTIIWRTLFYFLLFSLSLLVFDSVTMVIGVMFAVFSLHYFLNKRINKPPF